MLRGWLVHRSPPSQPESAVSSHSSRFSLSAQAALRYAILNSSPATPLTFIPSTVTGPSPLISFPDVSLNPSPLHFPSWVLAVGRLAAASGDESSPCRAWRSFQVLCPAAAQACPGWQVGWAQGKRGLVVAPGNQVARQIPPSSPAEGSQASAAGTTGASVVQPTGVRARTTEQSVGAEVGTVGPLIGGSTAVSAAPAAGSYHIQNHSIVI